VHTRRDWRRFIDLPYRLYRGHPHWIQPLRLEQRLLFDRRRNPFFEHGRLQAFLAVDRQGAVRGRIAAIVNGAHLARYDDDLGFFGFFEAEHDHGVARMLLDAATAWLSDQGLGGVRGPVNPSMNDVAGLLVHGFDRSPGVFMPYNPPYYEELLLACGLERVMTLWAYFLHRKYSDPERFDAGVRQVLARFPGATIRRGRREDFAAEVARIRDIYNDASFDNWGFVPMTDAELDHLARLFRHLLSPELVTFLEIDGEPAGFCVGLPNVNEILTHLPDGRLLPFGLVRAWLRWKLGTIHTVRLPLAGVRRQYHGHGLSAVVALAAARHGLETHYDGCELSWILDTNKVVLSGLRAIGAVRDKEYALYEARWR
jgi:hypothetical protein